jgi:transcriptional regulator with XRE-family HTH domain
MTHLKEWREKRGFSQRELAKLSGVHYVSIAKIEMDQLDPRLSTLLKLCKVLGVSLTELVGPPKQKGGRDGAHKTKG